jgi:hypothetical protein
MSLAVSTSEHRSNSAARLTLMRSPGPGPVAATYAATRRKAAQLCRAIAHPEIGRIDKHGHPLSAGQLLRAEMHRGKRGFVVPRSGGQHAADGRHREQRWRLGVS